MYGSDTSQAAGLAATGLGGWGISVGWSILAVGVLLIAGITLMTIGSVARYRARRAEEEQYDDMKEVLVSGEQEE